MNRYVRAEFSPLALAACLLPALGGALATAAEPATLELLQTIPLKGAPGRLDHLAIDGKNARLFVANLSNNSLDIVDLKAGKLLKQIPDQRVQRLRRAGLQAPQVDQAARSRQRALSGEPPLGLRRPCGEGPQRHRRANV
jgi:hypothetical protein